MNSEQNSQNASPAGLTRRRLLQRAGALGLAAAAAGAVEPGRSLAALSSIETGGVAAALALTPEQEEGPFYVALDKLRKNITLGRPGVPLRLMIKVVDSAGTPLAGSACDIWQCDATGVYSDESSESTVGQTWLRGVQLTNATGVAEFTTIYPGHYQGRTTHIHVKVHVGGKTSTTSYSGGHVSHTGQLLFDDAITSKVYALTPYTSDTAARVLNTADHVYADEHGSKSVLKLSRLGSSAADGYLGTITLVVNPSATPAAVGASGAGGPP
ncbi:MAG TPA: intradiol ring-cleavage dioxygenase [Gaiellaceae bacterium]|jgi:protocatechuate 3,4-dioxygenase beta subunit